MLSAAVVPAIIPSDARSASCGITERLVADQTYVCHSCNSNARPIDIRTVTEVDADSTIPDMEATFCYLGDMPCSGEGRDSAITARCCMAGWKFRKLLPVYTTRHLSWGVWYGVFDLRPPGYALQQWNAEHTFWKIRHKWPPKLQKNQLYSCMIIKNRKHPVVINTENRFTVIGKLSEYHHRKMGNDSDLTMKTERVTI